MRVCFEPDFLLTDLKEAQPDHPRSKNRLVGKRYGLWINWAEYNRGRRAEWEWAPEKETALRMILHRL